MYHRKLALLAGTSLSMSLAFAESADAASAASYSWTGFYVGGNLGYSWGKIDSTANVSPFAQLVPFQFDFPGGSSSIPLKPNGFIGGGQTGYNWQFAPHWLAGVEADWQWSGQNASAIRGFTGTTTTCAPRTSFPVCNFTNTTDISAKLSWFGTVRGRLGVMSNNILFYGTGGLAYGKVSVLGSNTFSVTNVGNLPFQPSRTVTYSTPFNYSETKIGWTLGAGIEGAIGKTNWTWKAEYLHIDLGSIGNGSLGSVPVLTVNATKFTDEILRFGVNYRFAAAR